MNKLFRSILFFFVLALSFLFSPLISEARDISEITSWYIKDFHSEIIVNTDGSLDITEQITADCGNLPDKHGIFRVLPTRFKYENKFIETPIKLISITDKKGTSHPFSTIKNISDHTLTWKIGDADKTVTGENYYEIKYRVRNAIIDGDPIDRIYWNLSGNQWDIDIDKFSADIKLPATKDKTTVLYYFGTLGSTDNLGANYSWIDDTTLNFQTTEIIHTGEGLTVDLAVPSGAITNAGLTWWEKYGNYVFILIPILVFVFLFNYWKKYGKDPKLNKSVMAEYEPPKGLSPGEIQTIARGGYFENKIITAELIYLATKGYLKIEEVEKKGLFGGKDYILTKTDKSDKLLPFQKTLLEWFFVGEKVTRLSVIKSNAAANSTFLTNFQNDLQNHCELSGYLEGGSKTRMIVMLIISIMVAIGGIALASINLALGIYVGISGAIILVFSFLMPRLTPLGAELAWQIKGLRLFMTTAEKYRQQFNEKENIFDKLLPYAIVFGITGLWIKKMKLMYGEKYFTTYHPVWYYGSLGSFNVDSFTSAMNSVSSAVSSASSSGSGGAGGGGGGGGGGGW